MFVFTVLTLFLAIIANALIWIWRLFVALRETATQATMSVYNNKGLFALAILVTTTGVALKLGQAEVQVVLDQFYECFVFELDQILWIFATAIRNGYTNIATRFNDIIAYFRGVLSDLRDSLQILLEQEVNGVIFSKSVNNVQIISDLFNIFWDALVTLQQWSISIPSFEIRFVTVSWTIILNYFTCQEVVFFRLTDSAIRLSFFSESCNFCAFKQETGATCFITDFVTPGVIQNCDECHNFFCEELTCNYNLIRNATTLLGFDDFADVIVAVTDVICCIYDLLDRPFYFITGAIQHLIDGQCLDDTQVADQIVKYAEEVLDCLDQFTCLVTGGKFCNSFQFLVTFLYDELGVVINGTVGMADCMSSDDVSNCFSEWPFNCNEPIGQELQGFAHCFLLIDNCMAEYTLWQPLETSGFFGVWEDFMNLINSALCAVVRSVLEILFQVCKFVNNSELCYLNLSGDPCDNMSVANPLAVVECVYLIIGDIKCTFEEPICPPCCDDSCPGIMGNCASLNPNAFGIGLDTAFNYYDFYKRKVNHKLYPSDEQKDVLLKTLLCLTEGSERNDSCTSQCIFDQNSCSTSLQNTSANVLSFGEWIRILQQSIRDDYYDLFCTKEFLFEKENHPTEEYQKCLISILKSFRRDIYLEKFPLLNSIASSNLTDPFKLDQINQKIKDLVSDITTRIKNMKLLSAIATRIQKTEFYNVYREFRNDFDVFNRNTSLVLYQNKALIFPGEFGAVHYYDEATLKEIYLNLKYINFTEALVKIREDHKTGGSIVLKKKTKTLSERLTEYNEGPIGALKKYEENSRILNKDIAGFLNHVNTTFYSLKMDRYERIFKFFNEKVVRMLKIDRRPTYQFLHAAYNTLHTKDISNISRWIRGEVFYIPHQGFVNKTQYAEFIGDSLNPLNPGIYQPTENLSYRNATFNLGIFLTGIIFTNFTFENIGSLQGLPEFLNLTKNNIEKRMIYEYARYQTYLSEQDPETFSFDTWFTVSFVGGIMNRLFGLSKTFFYDWIIKGIDYLESLDWKKSVLDPILFWSSNSTNCIWPDQVNGTDLYNPFCLPFLPEALTRFIEPLPNGLMPTQINWPVELIDVENGGQCKNTYTGNSNFIFTFLWSDNCKPQTQNFGRAVALMGESSLTKIALISSVQDGFYGSRSGLVYIYKENKTNPFLNEWILIQQIEAIDTTQPERTGYTISTLETASVHRVLIGSPGAEKKVGLIRVFDVDPTTGLLSPFQNITAPNIPFIGFSTKLGVSTTIDDTLIAGGVPAFNNQRGAALIYQLNTTTQQYQYIQVIEIPAFELLRDNTQFFGTSVKLEPSKGLIFVGAPNFPIIPFGLLGYPTINNGFVLYFAFDSLNNRFDTDVWSILEPVGTSSQLDHAFYGTAITSDGPYLMVSAPGFSQTRGAVFIYHDDCAIGTCYDLKHTLTGTNVNENFGACVYYKEPFLIIGIPGISTIVVYEHTPPHIFTLVTSYTGVSDFVGASCYVDLERWIAGGIQFNSGVGTAKSRTIDPIETVGVATFNPTTQPVTRPSCSKNCDYCKRTYVRGQKEEVVFGFTQNLQPCEVVGFEDALDVILFAVSYLANVLNTVIFDGVSFKFISDYGLVAIIIATLIFSGFTYLIVVIPLFFIIIWLLRNMFGEYLPIPVLIIGFILLAAAYGLFSISITSNAAPIIFGFAILVTWVVFIIGGYGRIEISFTQELLELVQSFQRNPLTSWIPGLDILAFRIPKWIYPNNQIPPVDIFCFYLNFGEIGLSFLAGFSIYFVAYLIVRAAYVTWLFIWTSVVLLFFFIKDIINTYFTSNPTASYELQKQFKKDIQTLKSIFSFKKN